jgi:hypothetical protein
MFLLRGAMRIRHQFAPIVFVQLLVLPFYIFYAHNLLIELRLNA